MTYNITITTITTIVCTKWIIGSVPLQKVGGFVFTTNVQTVHTRYTKKINIYFGDETTKSKMKKCILYSRFQASALFRKKKTHLYARYRVSLTIFFIAQSLT